MTAESDRPFLPVSPPQWLLKLWAEIDTHSVGSSLEAISENAVLQLGANRFEGKDAISEALRSGDPNSNTRHRVVGCWSNGSRLIIDGRLRVTTVSPANEQESVVAHFIDMDETIRTKSLTGQVPWGRSVEQPVLLSTWRGHR